LALIFLFFVWLGSSVDKLINPRFINANLICEFIYFETPKKDFLLVVLPLEFAKLLIQGLLIHKWGVFKTHVIFKSHYFEVVPCSLSLLPLFFFWVCLLLVLLLMLLFVHGSFLAFSCSLRFC
jgi:hypothetical protein